MPATGIILIVFFAALVLTRLRVPLGAALIAGGIGLDLWAGATFRETAVNLLHALCGLELWLMLAVMCIIIEIGRFLTEDCNSKVIIEAVKSWGGRHGAAGVLAGMPAVIGLIPMPGGALLSAPFVEQTAGAGDELKDWKASVNYWFRHVWEYWWPLYPGVIVAMSLFDMERWRFISGQIFCSVVAIVSGYYVMIRPHVQRLSAPAPAPAVGPKRNWRALFLVCPIVIVVVSMFAVSPLIRAAFPHLESKIAELFGMLAGLILALLVILADELRRRNVRMFRNVLSKSSLSIQSSLFGILVFKFMLEASGLLPLAGRELVVSGIPASFVVAALPFLAGLVTGLAFGFTGTSFPLVVGMMKTEGSGLTPMSTLVLAYGFGYIGMMVSPVHLCLLVTRDYFGSSLKAIILKTLPCMLAILVYVIIAHIVLGRLGL